MKGKKGKKKTIRQKGVVYFGDFYGHVTTVIL